MALASIDDFTVRLGRSLDDPETQRAQAALDDASELVKSIATIPDPTPAGVITVVCSAALRLFNNPEGLTSETVGTYTWRVDGAGLFLTPYEEQTIIRLSSSTGPRGLWTQSLTRDGVNDPIFGIDQYGGDPILLATDCSETGIA